MNLRNSTLMAAYCAASCTWTPPARANVQIYGALDSFLQYARIGSQTSAGLMSGGASTSRFGFIGSENLGGGLRVSFRLESGFDLMSGRPQSATSFYNREANIAISSVSWGTIKLGKQYPAIMPEAADPFYLVGQLSPFASTAIVGGDLGHGAASLPGRIENAISYKTPTYGGLDITVLYALRNAAGASTVASNAGAVANFARGPLILSGAYNAIWAATSSTLGGSPDGPRTDSVMASASYAFGPTLMSLAYTLMRPTAPGTRVAQVYSVGAIWQRGPHAIRADLAYRVIAGHASHALGALLGYDYQFSKLTGVYGRIGGFKNTGQSALSFGSAPVSAPGMSSTVFALGLRQKF
ncbi:Outer membrane protein, (Porin)-like protein [Paraburkholderia piptadeniae]|uniref:Porin n=2 Tax=Paraburkholderia TaxID=1822464 RepID=A0A7X1NC37_9BURK|nr:MULTISPECIES: porin [Paraburkholderia]MPW18743.1 porin [Paraburkholderia franconis]SIT48274.1 Outer membrane protein, (Porin)-like protein [Paraburkholderia piptadeniae]